MRWPSRLVMYNTPTVCLQKGKTSPTSGPIDSGSRIHQLYLCSGIRLPLSSLISWECKIYQLHLCRGVENLPSKIWNHNLDEENIIIAVSPLVYVCVLHLCLSPILLQPTSTLARKKKKKTRDLYFYKEMCHSFFIPLLWYLIHHGYPKNA